VTRRALAWALVLALTPTRFAAALTVVDDTGQPITLSTPPTRIVSLAPGATEMLFAAGAGAHVIATTQFADEPPAARRVPRIGDVVAIDMERLAALRPDLAVVWPGGGNPAQNAAIARLHVPLYRQQVNRFAEMPDSLRRLGSVTGTARIASQAAQQLQAHLDLLERKYARGPRRRVLLQIWSHPIYTVGGTQLMSDALRLCGATNIFADLRELAPAVDVQSVIARDPDIIVAAAEPGLAAQWLADWRRFTSLRAVRSGRLIAFEDPRLTRLGPSALEATELLCERLAAVP